MKKLLNNNCNYFLLVFSLLTSYIGNAQGKFDSSFKLQGKAYNTPNGKLFISYEKTSGERIYDSILIRNSEFSYSGYITEPTLAYLSDKTGNSKNYINFYIEPKTILISIKEIDSLKVTQIEGSKSEEESKLLERMRELSKDSSSKFWKNSEDITKEFILTHPTSIVSLKALVFYKIIWPYDTLLAFYKKLDPYSLNWKTGKQLTTIIKSIEENTPGKYAKSFSVTDMNGKAFNLKELKGKFVLIDFWASWCIPCRKENPKLVEMYEKFKEKGFEIVGISVDRKETDWREAIEKDNIDIWIQILNNEKTGDPILLKNLYSVYSYPTKYLIDPEGKIIGRYIGTSDAVKIESELIKIFNN